MAFTGLLWADSAGPEGGDELIHRLEDGSSPKVWCVVGPLPNEIIPAAERMGSVPRAGLDRDYLTQLGGETSAVIEAGTRVAYVDPEGRARETTALTVPAGGDGLVDLIEVFRKQGPTEHQVAYAFCRVVSAERQTVHALFGRDDRARVWVNGERVHQFIDRDRGVNPEEDQFDLVLETGVNRILVKVENGGGGWGFALRLFDGKAWSEQKEVQRERQRRGRAIGMELRPGGRWDSFVIAPGALPEPRWAHPELMTEVFGEMELRVRWFDRELDEVSSATAPGRYLAYVEAQPAGGPVIRRALTYYVAPAGFEPWRADLRVPLPALEGAGIDGASWAEATGAVARFGGQMLLGMLYNDPSGALLLAALHDRQMALAAGANEPWAERDFLIRHQEVHLALKRKLFGPVSERTLQAPRPAANRHGPVLRDGTEAEAGFAQGLGEALTPLAEAWAAASDIPFTLVVARHGVIAHHGAYGSWQGRAVDRTQPFDIASISKLLTGTLLVRFLDQDLVGLDVPIGSYLPDFPMEGDKAVSLRQSMMHLLGTEGHGTFGGFDNPWFENQVLHQLQHLQPGARYLYNGLSLNLAGRCLEAVAGKAFVRLMHEGLFDPLGMENTTVFDTAFGVRTTARDLARVGQLLLNRGVYGDREFFSEAAFSHLLPVRVGDVQPDCQSPDVVYGLGSTWERGPVDPDASANLPEEARSLLGWNTLSHGSATRSILRIDYDNDLVIAMCRPAGGPDYDEHWVPILRCIAAHLMPGKKPMTETEPRSP